MPRSGLPKNDNVSGNISGDYDDLDTVLGTSTALDISSVGNTGSDTEGIQWEAGVYEFYVTNIKIYKKCNR